MNNIADHKIELQCGPTNVTFKSFDGAELLKNVYQQFNSLR